MTSTGRASSTDDGTVDRGTGTTGGADRAGADGRGLTVTPFDRIVLIFNPESTGDAPQLAAELHADLARRLPEVPVVMGPTEHAGHA
jgi:hypothetical protein